MSKYLRSVLLFALLSSFAGSVPIVTQAQVTRLISQEDYNRLLDVVFSHQQPTTAQLYYSMVLRFMPSSHAESEVAVYRLTDGTIRAALFTVSGSTAWDTANDYIQRVGNTDIQQIAARVKVDREPLTVSSEQAENWYSGLQKSIGQSSVQLQQEMSRTEKTGETTVVLDGTTYELWFEQELTKVRWTVMDDEVSDARPVGHSALARWMNEIRQYALDHAVVGDRNRVKP